MKKFISVFAVIALLAVAAQAVEVKSANVAGVYTKTLPADNGLIALAVQIDPFNPGDATLEGVLGTDQLREDLGKSGEGDKVFIWNGTQYDIYFLKDSGGGVEWHDFNLDTPSNPPIESGQAMWIKSPAGSVGDNEITLTGQAVETSSDTLPIVAGLQLVSYPFSAEVAVSNTTFIASGSAPDKGKSGEGDKIFIWDPVGKDYTILLHADGNGFWAADSSPNTPSDAKINLGEGFWFRAISGFNWQENNPYLSNL